MVSAVLPVASELAASAHDVAAVRFAVRHDASSAVRGDVRGQAVEIGEPAGDNAGPGRQRLAGWLGERPAGPRAVELAERDLQVSALVDLPDPGRDQRSYRL